MSAPKSNDFTVKFANVNGTGSSSANGMFMKSLFRMGIPVVGKNYFPSNIQGLPTWYEVRANENGYLAPSGSVDIMVAMNAQTYDEDLSAVEPGGYLIYDSSWPRDTLMTRDDITVLGVPLAKMCNEAFDTARARTLMKNTTYVGVLAALLEMDMGVIEQLLLDTFGSKTHLIEANKQALEMGHDYAKENFDYWWRQHCHGLLQNVPKAWRKRCESHLSRGTTCNEIVGLGTGAGIGGKC